MTISTEHTHYDRFMAALLGIPANHVTKALNLQMSGIDWSRTSKKAMAQEYENAHTKPERAYKPEMKRINLVLLKKRALARMDGDYNWQEMK